MLKLMVLGALVAAILSAAAFAVRKPQAVAQPDTLTPLQMHLKFTPHGVTADDAALP